MEQFISDLSALDLSASVLLALTVLFILTGRLVPRATHEEVRQDRDTWRAACEAEREARIKGESQVEKLLVLSETTHDLIASLVRVKDE